MIIIRLQRTGSKNSPDFRIVLAEKHRSASKKVIAVLGQYNPITKKLNIKNQEELEKRLVQHVELSPTIHNLFITHKVMQGKKIQAWKPRRKAPAETTAAPAASAPSAA